jgi:hypothetical protein
VKGKTKEGRRNGEERKGKENVTGRRKMQPHHWAHEGRRGDCHTFLLTRGFLGPRDQSNIEKSDVSRSDFQDFDFLVYLMEYQTLPRSAPHMFDRDVITKIPQ